MPKAKGGTPVVTIVTADVSAPRKQAIPVSYIDATRSSMIGEVEDWADQTVEDDLASVDLPAWMWSVVEDAGRLPGDTSTMEMFTQHSAGEIQRALVGQLQNANAAQIWYYANMWRIWMDRP